MVSSYGMDEMKEVVAKVLVSRVPNEELEEVVESVSLGVKDYLNRLAVGEAIERQLEKGVDVANDIVSDIREMQSSILREENSESQLANIKFASKASLVACLVVMFYGLFISNIGAIVASGAMMLVIMVGTQYIIKAVVLSTLHNAIHKQLIGMAATEMERQDS